MSEWLTIECEKALYADRGKTVVLCDRLPSPVTLVVKVSDEELKKLRANARSPGLRSRLA